MWIQKNGEEEDCRFVEQRRVEKRSVEQVQNFASTRPMSHSTKIQQDILHVVSRPFASHTAYLLAIIYVTCTVSQKQSWPSIASHRHSLRNTLRPQATHSNTDTDMMQMHLLMQLGCPWRWHCVTHRMCHHCSAFQQQARRFRRGARHQFHHGQ